MPAQPLCVASGLFQRLHKRGSAFVVNPVRRVAVEDEVAEAARKKMIGDKSCGCGRVFENARKFQLRTAKTEVHRRFFAFDDEVRQIVTRSEEHTSELQSH